MSAGANLTSRQARCNGALLRHWLRWHPEWWALLLSALAWLFVGLSSGQAAPSWAGQMCSASRTLQTGLDDGAGWPRLGYAVGHIASMTVAMMLPLVIAPLRHVAFRSLWHRRERALTMFLGGYLLVWLLAGSLAGLIITRGFSDIPTPLGPTTMTLAGFALAAAWHIAPARQRALRICHRTVPLAPTGWRADWACLRYGWFNGRHCLLACGAMMLAASLAPLHLAAMIGISAISLAERYCARLTTPIGAGLLLALGGALAAISG